MKFILLIFLSSSLAVIGSASYMGCYRDNKSSRDLPLKLPLNGMSSKLCIAVCRAANYKFAGLQLGVDCMCGDSYGRHGKVPDSECKKYPCQIKNEHCGSDSRSRIFKTGYQPQSNKAKSLGCFADNSGSRDLTFFSNNHIRGVKEFCRKESCYLVCKSHGYKYFGLQNSNECFCGNSYGRYGLRPMKECNKRCQGNWNENCGGFARNLIFSIV